MSTTDRNIIEGELVPIESDKRMSAGTLDELYIDCFLDNPSNKVEALRRAAELAGVNCDTSRQRATQIHRRLQHKIDAGLTRRVIEGATLGYSVLYKMASDENTGEAVRAKCASLLVEYAGKNKLDTSENVIRDRDDIQAAIKETQLRIAQLTGQNSPQEERDK